MHGHALGERARPHRLVQRLAVGRVDRAFGVEPEATLAQHRLALQAVMAGTAAADQGDDDMVTRDDVGHPGADRLDDAGGLVAIDRGQRSAPAALHVGDVAVADGAGGDLDRDLANLRRVEPRLLDRQRRPELAADRNLHDDLSPSADPHGITGPV